MKKALKFPKLSLEKYVPCDEKYPSCQTFTPGKILCAALQLPLANLQNL